MYILEGHCNLVKVNCQYFQVKLCDFLGKNPIGPNQFEKSYKTPMAGVLQDEVQMSIHK